MKSFSEIETISKRASRAAGYSWGIAEEVGKGIRLLELFGLKGVKNLNEYYQFRLSEKFENLQGLKVCVLGLSFKAGTDDIRESSSINLINQLSNSGVIINTYDPVSVNNAKKILPETINFFNDPYDAINEVQATIIMTEWSEFQNLDWEKVYKSMENSKIIFDGKNFLDQKLLQALGFDYFAVGRKIKSQK